MHPSEAAFRNYLSALPPQRLFALASTYADLVYAEGLAVTLENGFTRPITPLLTPVVVDGPTLQKRAKNAALLAQAIGKAARGLLAGAEREVVLSGLCPLERQIVEAHHRAPALLATSRADYFVTARGELKALELNATIPAMQGYSDIAASGLLRVVGKDRGLSAQLMQQLIARNGSNTSALLQALKSAYRRFGGPEEEPKIWIVTRRQDAQLTELTYLARNFASMGTETEVAFVDEVKLEGDKLTIRGEAVQLCYRHIFARRLDPDSDFARALRAPDKFPIFNPVSPQFEVKAVLAALSECAHDEARAESYGLGADERALARDGIPWTRRLAKGPTTGPGGEKIDDLLAYVSASPADFVVKRSFEYGGKATFVGKVHGEESAKERVYEIFSAELGWKELVARCAEDARGGGFVVQRYVEATKVKHLLCLEEGPAYREVYVDYGGFASLGIDGPSWGGVCRASVSPVVNIVGGGGVAPLIRADVLERLVLS